LGWVPTGYKSRTLGQSIWDKVRCYWGQIGEHIGNNNKIQHPLPSQQEEIWAPWLHIGSSSLATSYFFYHFWPRLTTGPQIWGHNNVITYIVIITPLFYHNSTMNWQYFHLILGFSIKSGKHGTKSLSLVRNRVRFQKKKPAKKYTLLAFNGRSNSEMHHFLCQTEFHPVLTPSFSFFLSASIAATYIFTAPTCTTTTITSNLVH